MRWVLFAAAAFAAWYFVTREDTVAVETADGFSYPGYAITPQKAYSMQARVLGRLDYSSGREAELSPVDLALGWGPMVDPANIREIEISQRNRFYFWRVDRFHISRTDIEHNSANVHIIPANREVAERLQTVRKGDVVTLEGQLVNVDAGDGWRWRTSLSFTDTGKGACELLWLEHLDIQG